MADEDERRGAGTFRGSLNLCPLFVCCTQRHCFCYDAAAECRQQTYPYLREARRNRSATLGVCLNGASVIFTIVRRSGGGGTGEVGEGQGREMCL